MDILGVIELPAWLVACLLVTLTIIMYTVHKRGAFRKCGIPTKPSTFFFGDTFTVAKQGLELYSVKMVNQYGKVFGTFWGNMPVLVVTDTDFIKEVLVKKFSSFPTRFRFKSKPTGMNSSLTVAEGDHWRYLRSTLSPCFTTGKLRKMNANIGSCIENLQASLQQLSDEKPEGFDISPVIRAYTLDVILKTGFGVEVDSQRNPDSPYVRNAATVTNANMGHPIIFINMLFPDMPGLERVEMQVTPKEPQEFFKDACKKLYEERKNTEWANVDLLQTMVNAHKEEAGEDVDLFVRKAQTMDELKRKGLTDDEILTNSLVFMIAGFETTATTLAWLAYDMAVHTDCQQKLIQEVDTVIGQEQPNYDSVLKMKYLDMVVSESLRFHPVAAALTRRAAEDTEVCGIPVPKGVSVLCPAFALHFMAEYWEDPQQYKPERFAPENKANLNEYAYMPFGMGPRNCIGMRLAQLEVKMTLVSILQKYTIVKTDQLPIPMPGTKKGFYKPDKPVCVKLVRR